jgi:hypothetical protein
MNGKEVVMYIARTLRIAAVAAALSWAGVAAAQTITGQVVGVVTDAETGRPIVGATVTATSPGWIPQSVTTDSRGYYVLTLLPPDRYTVVASAPGYGPATSSGIPVFIDWRVKNDLKLASAKALAPLAGDAPQVALR